MAMPVPPGARCVPRSIARCGASVSACQPAHRNLPIPPTAGKALSSLADAHICDYHPRASLKRSPVASTGTHCLSGGCSVVVVKVVNAVVVVWWLWGGVNAVVVKVVNAVVVVWWL